MWEQFGLSGRDRWGLLVRFVLDIMVPQALFFLGLEMRGLMAGLVLGGGWTVALQLYGLARRRAWDLWLVYGLVFTIVQGLVSFFTRSPAVYTAGGIVENLLAGVALLAVLVLARPFLARILSAMLGARTAMPRSAHVVLGQLAVGWALMLLARGGGLYAALTHLPLGQFLVVNTVTGWPVNAIGVVLSLVYARSQLGELKLGSLRGSAL
jgi:hypothetical protein